MIQNVTNQISFLRLLKLFLLVCYLPVYLLASDIDNDLVPDSEDMCPNTPQNVFVDRVGCIKGIKKTVHFEHSSWVLDMDSLEVIQEVIALAKELNGYKIYIQGHTDATSDTNTNIYYSRQRASNVFEMIAKEIDKKRIVVSWYGESEPIASNTTQKGMQSNRRVTILLR